MPNANRIHCASRLTLQVLVCASVGGCASLGQPMQSLIPASRSLSGSGLSSPLVSVVPGGVTGEASPIGRGRVALPSSRLGGSPALRTHDLPSPAGRSVWTSPPSGLGAQNGALVGGLLGTWVGLSYPPQAGELEDRTLAVLAFGSLGALNGALIGALGADPRCLLWPFVEAGAFDDPDREVP